MNKREVVWLIIRLIGVYFAYSAVVSALSLFGSIYNYASFPSAAVSSPKTNNETIRTRPTPPGINMPEADNPVKNETNAPADKAKSEAFKLIFWFVLLIGLYGVAGWYLIRDGKYLFAVLNREEANGEEKQVPQVTSLNL
jgi:hypothetical protein